MLAFEGLGASTDLWSYTTGACSTGFQALCKPYSGANGKAYNCVGCGSDPQGQILALQNAMRQLITNYSLGAQFVSYPVAADKVIGLYTTRAVGVIGTAAQVRGIDSSRYGVTEVIGLCLAAKSRLEAQAVDDQSVQIAIQQVAKYLPALLSYFQAALASDLVPSPENPEPEPTPVEPQPEPGPELPVVDLGARKRRFFIASGLLLAVTSGLMIGAAMNRNRRRRR